MGGFRRESPSEEGPKSRTIKKVQLRCSAKAPIPAAPNPVIKDFECCGTMRAQPPESMPLRRSGRAGSTRMIDSGSTGRSHQIRATIPVCPWIPRECRDCQMAILQLHGTPCTDHCVHMTCSLALVTQIASDFAEVLSLSRRRSSDSDIRPSRRHRSLAVPVT